MRIFDKIKSAIWGEEKPAVQEVRTASITQPTSAPTATPIAPAPVPKPVAPQSSPVAPQTAAQAPTPTVATSHSPAPAIAAQNVDVAAILDKAAKASGQSLNWRTSIVDTMKALNLDSSITARKELADELGYTGDKNDSATMNVWLQKALMKKLAENGGHVPADLTN